MNSQQSSKINWIQVGGGALLGAIVAVIFLALNNQVRPAPIVITPAPTTPIQPTPTAAPLSIFINGAVNSPGVHVLDGGGRVSDAIEAAGGFSADAYRDNINLAAELSDGMQIFVSTIDQANSLQQELLVAPIQESRNSAPASESDSVNANGLIDINSADKALLETIPGVGPATAENIIGFRELNGPFATIDEIMNVPGIGEGKFADMEQFITVGNE